MSGIEGSSVTVRDYARVVRRRKWIMLLAIVLAPLTAVVLSLRQQELFQARADVLLTRQSLAAQLTGAPDPLASQSPDRFMRTQADLARTPEVAARVLRAAKIQNRGPYDFLAMSGVSPRADADVLEFYVADGDPAVAASLATVYARQFLRYRLQLDTASYRRARQEISKRLADLEASGERQTELYRGLVNQVEELKTFEALQSSNAYLVRPADSAGKIQPRPVRNGVLGLMVGIVLGMLLAFLREALDTRIRSADEIAQRLGQPLLARLPAPPGRLSKKDKLVMLAEPANVQAEAFRMLRTNVELACLDRNIRTIMVTSAVEREGKSTTAANLALAFARAGQRVILVDLDFRRPYLARFFNLDGRPGLTQVALGRASLRDAATPIVLKGADHLPGNGSVSLQRALAVITTGPVPPDPGEFVATSIVGEILATLRDKADIVLVDAPPLLHVGDALVLARHVDAVLLVTRLNSVNRPILAETRRLLDQTTTRRLGFVVTEAEAEEGYAYAAYYGYQSPQRAREPVA